MPKIRELNNLQQDIDFAEQQPVSDKLLKRTYVAHNLGNMRTRTGFTF